MEFRFFNYNDLRSPSRRVAIHGGKQIDRWETMKTSLRVMDYMTEDVDRVLCICKNNTDAIHLQMQYIYADVFSFDDNMSLENYALADARLEEFINYYKRKQDKHRGGSIESMPAFRGLVTFYGFDSSRELYKLPNFYKLQQENHPSDGPGNIGVSTLVVSDSWWRSNAVSTRFSFKFDNVFLPKILDFDQNPVIINCMAELLWNDRNGDMDKAMDIFDRVYSVLDIIPVKCWMVYDTATQKITVDMDMTDMEQFVDEHEEEEGDNDIYLSHSSSSSFEEEEEIEEELASSICDYDSEFDITECTYEYEIWNDVMNEIGPWLLQDTDTEEYIVQQDPEGYPEHKVRDPEGYH